MGILPAILIRYFSPQLQGRSRGYLEVDVRWIEFADEKTAELGAYSGPAQALPRLCSQCSAGPSTRFTSLSQYNKVLLAVQRSEYSDSLHRNALTDCCNTMIVGHCKGIGSLL